MGACVFILKIVRVILVVIMVSILNVCFVLGIGLNFTWSNIYDFYITNTLIYNSFMIWFFR